MANVGSIKIREVWSENLDEEFDYIRSIIPMFRFVAMDTEFPGVVFRKVHTKQVSSTVNYSLLKQNVDALKIIQLGLTFVDSNGNLPNLGDPKYRYIWQFNFRDFDVSNDYHAPDSIAMLRTTGINFELNRKIGVDAVKFAELMMSSGLVCNGDDVTWVTFHCAYDFAYLYKVLTQVPLPSKLSTFLKLLNVYFGSRLFDVKYMIKFCDGLYGGLDRVAQLIEVDRMVGQSHQAGSDSLLTWLVFEKITEAYFSEDGIDKYNGMLYGCNNLTEREPRSFCWLIHL